MRERLSRLLDPLGLLVFGAGVTTTALTGEFWLVPLSLAAWALLAFGRQSLASQAPPVGTVFTPGLTGPLAEIEMRLSRLAQRIGKAVAEATPVVRSCVEELPSQAADLVEECRALLRKQSTLDVFLTEAEHDNPEQELERARAAERSAKDAGVRERWTQVRLAAEARVAEIEQIRTNRARMVAELAEAEIRLKQVLSRIVSLDSRDEERLTGLGSELRQVLGEFTQQIAVFDRVLPADVRSPEQAPEPPRQLQ